MCSQPNTCHVISTLLSAGMSIGVGGVNSFRERHSALRRINDRWQRASRRLRCRPLRRGQLSVRWTDTQSTRLENSSACVTIRNATDCPTLLPLQSHRSSHSRMTDCDLHRTVALQDIGVALGNQNNRLWHMRNGSWRPLNDQPAYLPRRIRTSSP